MKHWRFTIFLAVFVLGLSFLISLVRDQVFGQYIPSNPVGVPQQVLVRPPAEPSRWLVDFTAIDGPTNTATGSATKTNVITIVDPESKRILVYHEELSTGKVKLLSTRNIQPDILLDQFNAERPTPREIEDEIKRLRQK